MYSHCLFSWISDDCLTIVSRETTCRVAAVADRDVCNVARDFHNESVQMNIVKRFIDVICHRN